MEENTVAIAFLNARIHTDGSLSRVPFDPPLLPASDEAPAHGATQVRTKDITLNANHGTTCRLFLPPCPPPIAPEKLPILLHFHGGGFFAGSPAAPLMHDFLCTLSVHTRTLIVSVDYRLVPEHRLPCAYEDGIEALLWLREQANAQTSPGVDPWLASYGDFRRVFVAGESAGGNLAHHVVVRAVSELGFGTEAGDEDAGGIRLAGYILLDPFFAGEQPTSSEASQPEVLRQSGCIWRLSLPEGKSFSLDHPYANPLAGGPAEPWLASRLLPPALVAVSGEDALRDRGIAYVDALQGAGKQAKLLLTPGEDHCFYAVSPTSPNVSSFYSEVGRFIHG